MANLQESWSITAASNGNSDSTINWLSGALFSTDHASDRAAMARIAAFAKSLNGSISSTGSANAYAFASPTGHVYTANAAGMRIAFKANFSNSGAATLAVDGLTAKAITKYGATAVVTGDLLSGMVYDLIYDGTEFILLNPSGVQTLDATLTALAGLTIASGSIPVGSGSDTFTTLLNSSLCHLAGTEVITGSKFFSGSGASAPVLFQNTAAGADQTLWQIQGNGANLVFAAPNDAINASTVAMQLSRGSGYTVDNISFGGHIYPLTDNTKTCGGAANRWSVVYSTTGTINTSDAREKTPLDPIPDNVKRAIRTVLSGIGSYRWLSAVADKGDAARKHVGVTAQALRDAFLAEGEDPARWGVFCADTVNGKEQLGVRYDELFALALATIWSPPA